MTKWDKKYREGYGANGTAEPSLVQAVAGMAPGHALDLACGLGRNALYLAAQGWRVTALDSSQYAIDVLPPSLNAQLADLESPGFQIAPDTYELICDSYYLDRDLFPKITKALRSGGLFVGVIPMMDDDATLHPMNSAFLCAPGELRAYFPDWEILHDYEGKPGGAPGKRKVAELTARKP